jgi:hypothetical protein
MRCGQHRRLALQLGMWLFPNQATMPTPVTPTTDEHMLASRASDDYRTEMAFAGFRDYGRDPVLGQRRDIQHITLLER